MAMRLFTREEFEAELTEKLGLTKTDERTSTAVAWRTPVGQVVLIPEPEDGERYPDCWLDEACKQVKAIEKSTS